jgi:hypothetical protein
MFENAPTAFGGGVLRGGQEKGGRRMMAEAGGRCPITNSARLSSSLVLNEVLLNLIKVLSIVLFLLNGIEGMK